MPDSAHSRGLFATLLLGICLLLWATPCRAVLRLTGKSELPTAAQISNPKPAEGDIILPMPGGLSMALRPVCVPAGGYLDDVRQAFGVVVRYDGKEEAAEAWADQRYIASLSAPFELADMPPAWGQGVREWIAADPATAAASSNGLRPFLYFIGKYEVTRGQWRAIMEDGADFSIRAGDDRPVSNISWFETVEFTYRYSRWLMKNHPEFLPFFEQEQRSSFIRLPTETEWEYAARGGHRVSAVDREHTTLHPAPESADMSEYIVAIQYDSTLTGSAAIGTRKANPLGVFDILGNCAEMVQSPFQLVASGQLLGNQGGVVIKGGSWRAFSTASLHPGRRIEADYYVNGDAQRRDDLGFRICLGTILTPRDRRAALQSEWEKRRSPQAAQATSKQDVRIIIREVVREVESPVLRQRLAEAEEVASLYHEQVNVNEERMMREVLMGATFSLETIANYAARCYQLIKLVDAYNVLPPGERDNHRQHVERTLKEIHGFVQGMRGALFYYRGMLASAANMDASRLLRQLESLRIQFSHEDGFSRNMGRRLTVLQRHIESGYGRGGYCSDRQDLGDMLPAWLLERLMVYWEKTI